MDRARFEKLVSNAVRAEVQVVDLPELGPVSLRKLNREQAISVITASQGDVDWQAKALVGVLRHALVDEDGNPLCRSFAEAAQFFNAMPDADAGVLLAALRDRLTEATSTDGDGSGEVGKAS